MQAVTEADLNIRTYAGKKTFFFLLTKMPLTRFTDSVLSFPSVGFRNHAAADPGCHSDRLLQQMDEGRRCRVVPHIGLLML